MSRKVYKCAVLGLAMLAGVAVAQAKPAQPDKTASIEIVPIDKEPSHHLVFENEYVRVFSVEVAPHSETKYHQHDRDYVWVALGDSDVESVRVGAAMVSLQPKDGEAQFTKGGFAHKAVNRSDKPFRNVTVELKKGTIEVDAAAAGEIIAPGGQKIVLKAKNVSCWKIRAIRHAGGLFEAELQPGNLYLLLAGSETQVRGAGNPKPMILKTGAFQWLRPTTTLNVQAWPEAGATLCQFE